MFLPWIIFWIGVYCWIKKNCLKILDIHLISHIFIAKISKILVSLLFLTHNWPAVPKINIISYRMNDKLLLMSPLTANVSKNLSFKNCVFHDLYISALKNSKLPIFNWVKSNLKTAFIFFCYLHAIGKQVVTCAISEQHVNVIWSSWLQNNWNSSA